MLLCLYRANKSRTTNGIFFESLPFAKRQCRRVWGKPSKMLLCWTFFISNWARRLRSRLKFENSRVQWQHVDRRQAGHCEEFGRRRGGEHAHSNHLSSTVYKLPSKQEHTYLKVVWQVFRTNWNILTRRSKHAVCNTDDEDYSFVRILRFKSRSLRWAVLQNQTVRSPRTSVCIMGRGSCRGHVQNRGIRCRTDRGQTRWNGLSNDSPRPPDTRESKN